MPDCLLNYMVLSFVAYNNPHIKMQEFFVNKIHFYKFISMSKTMTRAVKNYYCYLWYKLPVERFSSIGTRKGK